MNSINMQSNVKGVIGALLVAGLLGLEVGKLATGCKQQSAGLYNTSVGSISNRIEKVKSDREQGLFQSADFVASYVEDDINTALRPDFELNQNERAQYLSLREQLNRAILTKSTNR